MVADAALPQKNLDRKPVSRRQQPFKTQGMMLDGKADPSVSELLQNPQAAFEAGHHDAGSNVFLTTCP